MKERCVGGWENDFKGGKCIKSSKKESVTDLRYNPGGIMVWPNRNAADWNTWLTPGWTSGLYPVYGVIGSSSPSNNGKYSYMIMFWKLAVTSFLALWKTSSSDQSGNSDWILDASTLCHRNIKIPKAKIAGFWFVRGSPNTKHFFKRIFSLDAVLQGWKNR